LPPKFPLTFNGFKSPCRLGGGKPPRLFSAPPLSWSSSLPLAHRVKRQPPNADCAHSAGYPVGTNFTFPRMFFFSSLVGVPEGSFWDWGRIFPRRQRSQTVLCPLLLYHSAVTYNFFFTWTVFSRSETTEHPPLFPWQLEDRRCSLGTPTHTITPKPLPFSPHLNWSPFCFHPHSARSLRLFFIPSSPTQLTGVIIPAPILFSLLRVLLRFFSPSGASLLFLCYFFPFFSTPETCTVAM